MTSQEITPTPDESPEPTPDISEEVIIGTPGGISKIGMVYEFGRFGWDIFDKNTGTPLRWKIMDKKDGRALLVLSET